MNDSDQTPDGPGFAGAGTSFAGESLSPDLPSEGLLNVTSSPIFKLLHEWCPQASQNMQREDIRYSQERTASGQTRA